MKPLFKNITKYTSQNYKQFVEFHNNKYNVSYTIYTFMFSIMLLYCIIVNAIQKNFLFALIFLLILVIYLYCRIILPTNKYKKTCEEYKNNKIINFEFSFYKYYYMINKKRFYYFKLHKVFETKEYFYLYINSENASLVSKKGFKIGNPEDFSNFIKKKCLLKYSKES